MLLTLQNRINNAQNWLAVDGFKKSIYDGLKQILLAGSGTAISANDLAQTLTLNSPGSSTTTLRLVTQYPIVASKPEFNIFWQNSADLGANDILSQQIASDSTFSTIVASRSLAVSSVQLQNLQVTSSLAPLADGTYYARIRRGSDAWSAAEAFIVDNLSALSLSRQSAVNVFTPVIRVSGAGAAIGQTISLSMTNGTTTINFANRVLVAGDIAAGVFTVDLTSPQSLPSGNWVATAKRNGGQPYTASIVLHGIVSIFNRQDFAEGFSTASPYVQSGLTGITGPAAGTRRVKIITNEFGAHSAVGAFRIKINAGAFQTLPPVASRQNLDTNNGGSSSALYEVVLNPGETLTDFEANYSASPGGVFQKAITLLTCDNCAASLAADFLSAQTTGASSNFALNLDSGEIFAGSYIRGGNTATAMNVSSNLTEDKPQFVATLRNAYVRSNTTGVQNFTITNNLVDKASHANIILRGV